MLTAIVLTVQVAGGGLVAPRGGERGRVWLETFLGAAPCVCCNSWWSLAKHGWGW